MARGDPEGMAFALALRVDPLADVNSVLAIGGEYGRGRRVEAIEVVDGERFLRRRLCAKGGQEKEQQQAGAAVHGKAPASKNRGEAIVRENDSSGKRLAGEGGSVSAPSATLGALTRPHSPGKPQTRLLHPAPVRVSCWVIALTPFNSETPQGEDSHDSSQDHPT